MSTTELAARMGLAQSSVVALEQSEAHDSIRLDSLRRAAEALDCDLVYALVPRASLNDIVTAQARRKAVGHLAPIAHSMRLEDQTVSDGDAASQIEEIGQTFIDRRGLWSEPPQT
jgi:predicted DNA-binding mobile mystery protein A